MLEKHLLLISFFLLCFGQFAGAESYGELRPDAEYSIQGLWHFNGDALDETSNNNDGSVTGASLIQLGKFGQTYDFDGDTDYIDIDDDPTLDFQVFTVSIWMNLDVNSQQQIVVKIGSPVGWRTNYGLLFHDTAGMVCSTFNISSTSFQAIMPLSDPQNLGWIHITCVHDGSDIKLYFNGREEASTPTSGTMAESTGDLRLGATDSMSNEFNGRLDEFILYNRALSPAEIRQTHAMQKGAYGIVD